MLAPPIMSSFPLFNIRLTEIFEITTLDQWSVVSENGFISGVHGRGAQRFLIEAGCKMRSNSFYMSLFLGDTIVLSLAHNLSFATAVEVNVCEPKCWTLKSFAFWNIYVYIPWPVTSRFIESTVKVALKLEHILVCPWFYSHLICWWIMMRDWYLYSCTTQIRLIVFWVSQIFSCTIQRISQDIVSKPLISPFVSLSFSLQVLARPIECLCLSLS